MSEYNFRPLFSQNTILFRGITNMWLEDGVLYAALDDGTEEVIGPVSSYADAVEHGYAGPGTDFPDEESWTEHIALVTEYTSNAEAWADGTRGGTAVDDGDPAYHNNSKYYSEQAANSASALNDAAERILGEGGAEDRITALEGAAKADAENAECWAVGTKDGIAVLDPDTSNPSSTNNAKYYSNLADAARTTAAEKAGEASTSETNASASATTAGTQANNAECWAVGTKNGTEITDADPTHPSKINNSKYYATEAGTNATNSSTNALKSEGYAVGKQGGTDVVSGSPYYHNNAKYYSELAAAYAATTTAIEYQISTHDSASQLDPDGWTTTVDLSSAGGKFLWTRATLTINGDNIELYSVGYIPATGSGTTSVFSVNSLTGDVVLTGQNIKVNGQSNTYIADALTPATTAQIDLLFP